MMPSRKTGEIITGTNSICPNPVCEELNIYKEGDYCRICGVEIPSGMNQAAKQRVIAQKRRNIDTVQRMEQSTEMAFV